MGFTPLNNITTADRYVDIGERTGGSNPPFITTLYCPGATGIDLEIANAAIFYQLGHGLPPLWDQEVFTGPKWMSIAPRTPRGIAADAIRVRSAKAGAPAQVSVWPR
jgi:hypothetical protein